MMKTRIIYMRHEVHKGSYGAGPEDVLVPEAEERAKRRGAKLRELGFKITAFVCGGKWDHLGTAQKVLEGYGTMVPINYADTYLGDTSQDPNLGPDFKPMIKAGAKPLMQAGMEKDRAFATVIYQNPALHATMLRRALEGEEAIKKIVQNFPGQDVLVLTSGVGRAEIARRVLKGMEGPEVLNIMDCIQPYGEAVLLTFTHREGGMVFELTSDEDMVLLDPVPKTTDDGQPPCKCL